MLKNICRALHHMGTPLQMHVYSNWTIPPPDKRSAEQKEQWLKEVNWLTTKFHEQGFTIVTVPNRKANAVDMKMANDMLVLAQQLPIQRIVIITGDQDFVHAIKSVQMQGIEVIGISRSNRVTDTFKFAVDLFVDAYHFKKSTKVMLKKLSYSFVKPIEDQSTEELDTPPRCLSLSEVLEDIKGGNGISHPPQAVETAGFLEELGKHNISVSTWESILLEFLSTFHQQIMHNQANPRWPYLISLYSETLVSFPIFQSITAETFLKVLHSQEILVAIEIQKQVYYLLHSKWREYATQLVNTYKSKSKVDEDSQDDFHPIDRFF